LFVLKNVVAWSTIIRHGTKRIIAWHSVDIHGGSSSVDGLEVAADLVTWLD
jgi:hypothetical protein